ncbi:MAG: alpha/beta fold hydrolase [Verrucomicrobiales bacterium]
MAKSTRSTRNNQAVRRDVKTGKQNAKGGYIRNAIITAATAQAVVVVKELFHYSMDNGRLLNHWTAIPSPIGAAPLRIHSRYRNDALTVLPPIVLLHGLGMGSSYMVPLGAQLAAEANVYVPELPGHGQSDHDVRPLKIQEMAEALATWMGQRGLRAATMVGHSMGCQIAAELAAKHPSLISGLVMMGPTSDPAAPAINEQIGRALKTSLSDRRSLLVWSSMDYTRAGRNVLREELKEIVRHRLEYTLPNLSLPVRVIRGEKDAIVSQHWARQVASLCHAGEPIVVANAGHAVHFSDPQTVAKLIIPFAKSLLDKQEPTSTPVLSEETARN